MTMTSRQIILVLALLAALFALFVWGGQARGGSCGIVPIKPPPPIGCRDVVPQCQCDSTGCRWVWICVR